MTTTQPKQTTVKQTTTAPPKPATTTQKPQTTTQQTTTQKPSTTKPQNTVQWSDTMKAWRKLCEGKSLSGKEQDLIRSEILEYAEGFNGKTDIHVSFGIDEYDISYEKPLNLIIRNDMTDLSYAHMDAYADADRKWLIDYVGNEENNDQYQNLIDLIPDSTLYYDFSVDTTKKNLSDFITETEESKRVLNPNAVVATDLTVTGELPDGTVFTEQFDILHEGETISFTVPVDLDNLTSLALDKSSIFH